MPAGDVSSGIIVFSISGTFSKTTTLGISASIMSMVGFMSSFRGSKTDLSPDRITFNIFPLPFFDIPWQGGVAKMKSSSDGLLWNS